MPQYLFVHHIVKRHPKQGGDYFKVNGDGVNVIMANESVHNKNSSCFVSTQTNKVRTYLIEFDLLRIPHERIASLIILSVLRP